MGLARLSIYETRVRDRTAPATRVKKGGGREMGAERERTKIEETRREGLRGDRKRPTRKVWRTTLRRDPS